VRRRRSGRMHGRRWKAEYLRGAMLQK
jgi:hypothetical protein